MFNEPGSFEESQFRALIAGVAHDFRNALTVVASCTDTLQNRLRLDACTELERIRTALDSARQLANQLELVAIGTSLTGGADVRTVVRSVVAQFASANHIELDIRTSKVADLSDVQLAQILANLLVNACEACESGSTVWIAASDAQSGGKGLIHLTVRDAGIGIGEDEIAHVFEPYFSTKETGRGVGLYAARAIAVSRGGDLVVESQIGAGTIFHVYLPVKEG